MKKARSFDAPGFHYALRKREKSDESDTIKVQPRFSSAMLNFFSILPPMIHFFSILPEFIRNGSFYYHDFCRFLEFHRSAYSTLYSSILDAGNRKTIVFEPFSGISENLSEMVRFVTTFLDEFSNFVGLVLTLCVYSLSRQTARNHRFFAEYRQSKKAATVPLEPVVKLAGERAAEGGTATLGL